MYNEILFKLTYSKFLEKRGVKIIINILWSFVETLKLECQSKLKQLRYYHITTIYLTSQWMKNELNVRNTAYTVAQVWALCGDFKTHIAHNEIYAAACAA